MPETTLCSSDVTVLSRPAKPPQMKPRGLDSRRNLWFRLRALLWSIRRCVRKIDADWLGSPLEDPRHLLNGAIDAGPGAAVTGERFGRAEAQDLVPGDDLPDVDHHRQRGAAGSSASTSALLGNDDFPRLGARRVLGLDLFHSRVNGEPIALVRGCELRLVGLAGGGAFRVTLAGASAPKRSTASRRRTQRRCRLR